jgi:four helix bundle protein
MPNAKCQMPNAKYQISNFKSISKFKYQMTNQVQSSKQKIYDLEERTAIFGETVIRFVKTISLTPYSKPLVEQIIRSATSIGANYMEADACNSKKDFINKLVISKKEAKETMHWLRMIAVVDDNKAIECRKLWKEAHELVLILSTIVKRKSI